MSFDEYERIYNETNAAYKKNKLKSNAEWNAEFERRMRAARIDRSINLKHITKGE